MLVLWLGSFCGWLFSGGVWCQTRCIEGWGVCAMGATGVCGLGWLYGGGEDGLCLVEREWVSM